MDPQQEQEPCDGLFDEIRSAFTPVKPSTAQELLELAGSIFTSDDYWANSSDHYYIEPAYTDDPAKPLLRLFEQKPAISSITFSIESEGIDDGIVEYARHALTRSHGRLLMLHSAMTWFFLGYGLLPSCLRGHNSREKILHTMDGWERGKRSSGAGGSGGLFHARGAICDSSPVVFAGSLRPSELLERAQGYKSVVVFPYDGLDRDEDGNWIVTAYLLEFPQPIEPVLTAEELCEKLRASMAKIDSPPVKNLMSSYYFV